jgi:hypothetical protein
MTPSDLRRLLAGCMLLAALLLGACGAPFHAGAPKGFAPLDSEDPFRAVTPEGVMYRVRHEPNQPRADLQFWRKALKQRMDEAGYVFVDDGEIKASAVPGYRLELAAPFGPQDYAYLIALFVNGDKLTLVEAAGEVSQLREHRNELLAAIRRIRW